MLGHWKNFDELESTLSLEELTALLDVSRKKDYEDKKFYAAIQGVELDGNSKEVEDVAELNNRFVASQEGFGVGEGLGFIEL